MSKAIRLLTICVIMTFLLAAGAVWAWADAPDAEPPAETASPAETEPDPLAPVDVPAASPAGSVYAVGKNGAVAVTVVDLTADGADAGVRFDADSRYYYGAQITGADTGVVIDSAGDGYFGSSAGSIPLYDAGGAVSGIVWGGCRPTSVDCGVGFLLCGDVSGTILAEDGASFACRDAVILCSAGSGSFRFRNARLSSESGILLQTEPDAGDISLALENGFYSGELINGGGTLAVTVARGALLFGDTAQLDGPIEMTVAAGAAWILNERATLTSLTVEDGATVYGELLEAGGGSLILFPSDQVLEPGTYEAEPLAEELPMGHGPALPAEEGAASDEDTEAAPAPEQDAEEPSAPDMDAERAKKLFPLVPPAAEADAAPAEEIQDAAPTQAPDAAAVPAEDAEPTPAPEEVPDDTPAPSEAPDDTPASSEASDAVPSEPDHTTLRHSLLLGAGVASPSVLSASAGTFQPSLDLAARLAVRTTGQPPAASLLKTGAKSHSFLPQTLDNQAIILYNPYCCSAA